MTDPYEYDSKRRSSDDRAILRGAMLDALHKAGKAMTSVQLAEALPFRVGPAAVAIAATRFPSYFRVSHKRAAGSRDNGSKGLAHIELHPHLMAAR